MSRLILASSSPRRLMLLEQIGVKPDAVDPADIDESVKPDETPRQYVQRVAREKAELVATRHAGAFVLSGDTIVTIGRRILHKPETLAEAEYCWSLLPGRRNKITTAVCLIAPNGQKSCKLADATVTFRKMSKTEVNEYLAGGDWHGKAGGYSYQGVAAKYIRDTKGSFTTIIGLPVFEVSQMLTSLGYHAT